MSKTIFCYQSANIDKIILNVTDILFENIRDLTDFQSNRHPVDPISPLNRGFNVSVYARSHENKLNWFESLEDTQTAW
jgi:hypothetical protein